MSSRYSPVLHAISGPNFSLPGQGGGEQKSWFQEHGFSGRYCLVAVVVEEGVEEGGQVEEGVELQHGRLLVSGADV